MLDFFQDHLRILVQTPSTEKFLNICSNTNICLWRINPVQNGFKCTIRVKDLKKFDEIAQESHSTISILKKHGFHFWLEQYKHRKMFVFGTIIYFLIIIFLSGYIWTIQISGNQICTDEMIMNYLKAQNIKEGIPAWQIDCTKIAAGIRQKYDEIIWVSAYVDGTYLKINIKENETLKYIDEYKNESVKPKDIIADNDCIIEKIIVRQGIPLVKPGDIVEKGDILVSGLIPICNDAKEIIDYQYCEAEADINGKIRMKYNDNLLYSHKQKYRHEEIYKKEYFFKYKNILFKIGSIKNNYNNRFLYSKQKSTNNLMYGTRTIYPYNFKECNYTKIETQQILSERFQNYCKELQKKGVVILQNDVKIYTWRKKACATGQLFVSKPLGTLRHSKQNNISKNKIQSGEQINGNDGSNH